MTTPNDYRDPNGVYWHRTETGSWLFYTDGRWLPSSAPPPQPVAAPPVRQLTIPNIPWPPLAIIGCSFIVVIGSLLPWVTASAGLFSVSVAGTDGNGDGILTLIFGIAAAVMTGVSIRNPHRLLPIAAAVFLAVAVGVSLYDTIHVSNTIGNLPSGVSAGVGVGLWLCLLASIGGFAVAIWEIVQKRRAPTVP